MARSRSKIELSLFPFLNILFSLIGVLILYIFVILVMGRAGGRASIRAGTLLGRAAARADDRNIDAMKKKKEALQGRFNEINREWKQLQDERDQLALLIELRGRQALIPAAGTGSLGEPIGAPVPKEWRMVPAEKGSGDNRKTPILVQVTADEFIIFEFDRKDSPPKKIVLPAFGSREATQPAAGKPGGVKPGGRNASGQKPGAKAEQPPSPRLVEFLDGVDRVRRDKYLLFLIQPDGIEEFARIRDYCIARYTTPQSAKIPKDAKPADLFDFGFEPFSEDWLLTRKIPDDSR